MNKIKRSLLMFFPVLVFILSAVCLLIVTALKSGIYWAFKWENYWNLENEWFQITEEYKVWVHYWKTGRSRA